MTAPIFRDTWKPPTRWFRFKNRLAGFILHPAIVFAVIVLVLGIGAAVIIVAVRVGAL